MDGGATFAGIVVDGGALAVTGGVLTVNGALSFATLQKYLLDVQVSDSGGLTKTAQIAVEVEPRAVKREFWSGMDALVDTLHGLTLAEDPDG